MDAPERLDAGLLYTLKLAESSGHLSMHKERFVQRAVNLLRTPTVTWKAVAQRAFEMLKDNRLAIYRDHIYRPIIAQAENDVAVQVCEMLHRDKLPYMGDLDDEIDAQQKEMGFTFAQEQRNAIKTSLTSPICIISGGPGYGEDLHPAGNSQYLSRGISQCRCCLLCTDRACGAAYGTEHWLCSIYGT